MSEKCKYEDKTCSKGIKIKGYCAKHYHALYYANELTTRKNGKQKIEVQVYNHMLAYIKQRQEWYKENQDLKLTQKQIMEEIGERCNLTIHAIQAISRGKSECSLVNAFKIAEYFNVKVEEMFFINE